MVFKASTWLSPQHKHSRVSESNYYSDTKSKSRFSLHCPVDDNERANHTSTLKTVTLLVSSEVFLKNP